MTILRTLFHPQQHSLFLASRNSQRETEKGKLNARSIAKREKKGNPIQVTKKNDRKCDGRGVRAAWVCVRGGVCGTPF